jgi:hypothetical protein
MARKFFQLLLCASVLPFYPFVLLFTARMFTPSFWGEASTFTVENWIFFLIYPAAAIGIPALIVSIFVAPAAIRQKSWLARSVVIGLIAGSLTAVTFLAVTAPSYLDQRNWSSLTMSLWQIGGPLIVAVWNLARLWRAPRRAGAARSQEART